MSKYLKSLIIPQGTINIWLETFLNDNLKKIKIFFSYQVIQSICTEELHF